MKTEDIIYAVWDSQAGFIAPQTTVRKEAELVCEKIAKEGRVADLYITIARCNPASSKISWQ